MGTIDAEFPTELRSYLVETARSFQGFLGDDLLGLYLCGSLVQNDFKPAISDIDLLGIVSGTLDEAKRANLTSRIAHETLPVPAGGLEVVLFPQDAAKEPHLPFPFVFAVSTGPRRATTNEPPGIANDMLIDVALCREAGSALLGPPPHEAFGPVSQELLCDALIEELRWHLQAMSKDTDPVTPVNAILNAARSLQAAETGKIISKSKGARWWLQRYPSDSLVRQALGWRNHGNVAGIDRDRAREFVEKVARRLESRRG